MAELVGAKWQVQSDDVGNLYFCNSLTGESVWELPDEEVEDQDEGVDEAEKQQVEEHTPQLEKPKEQLRVYAVAVGVADVMATIVETIEEQAEHAKKPKTRKFVSPAAEKRFLRNAAHADKKKNHLRDRMVMKYVDVLVPSMKPGSAAGQEENRNKSQVGSLFTAEESRGWQQQREQEREAKRRAVRRAKRQHQKKVEALQRHQQLLIQFRSDLMKHVLGKIQCSTELQRQRILLLTTPQMLAEMMQRKRELQSQVEPEVAEKMAAEEKRAKRKYDQNLRKVFEAIDEAGAGKLHLLQILFGVFSKERPQKYAVRVRGLAELLGSTELQRFLIDFAAQSSKKDAAAPRLITVSELREFVTIIEDVLDHYAGVKAAVQDAENDIEATLAAAAASPAGGVSLARARMGAMSAKKMRHELAVLREHEAQLQAARHREKRRGFDSEGETLVAAKEEWQKNHHHRLIRLGQNLPVFCCLCRRRKWELWRREQEEIESEYRNHWPTIHALRVKDADLRFVQERDAQNGIPVEAAELAEPLKEAKHDVDASVIDNRRAKYELIGFAGRSDGLFLAVKETLVNLVMLVEATASKEASARSERQRKVHKKPGARAPANRLKAPPNAEVLERVKAFDREEQERKAMYAEDLHMVIMLERNRRSVERPFLRAQDAAHDAFVRLLEHCVNPCGFLSRLDFERCLAFSPPQRLVLAVADQAVKALKPPGRLVLQTIPCRAENAADYMFQHATLMQKTLRSPFVPEISSVEQHTFQLFSELGLLVECWPVVFVVSEYFEQGSWLSYYRQHFIEASKQGVKYAAVEQHLRNVFREVASGLAAMHSLGLLHLNVNLGNIYVDSSDTQSGNVRVKVSGLLSWKHDFDADRLQASDMHDCFNLSYAPPEVANELPVTAKADAWMLGCALCDALFLWQRQQLMLSTSNQPAQPSQPLVFHSKTISDILQRLPIATSASMRSLIRMLLQPNPAQRPQMSHVVDLLCRNI